MKHVERLKKCESHVETLQSSRSRDQHALLLATFKQKTISTEKIIPGALGFSGLDMNIVVPKTSR